MSGALAELADDMRSAANVVPAALSAALDAAAIVVRDTMRERIASDTGGDGTLSGMRGSARIDATYVLEAGAGGARAIITATGPAHIIERDTSPHRIPRARRPITGRGLRKHRVVAFDGRVYSHVMHPGTTGKRTFELAFGDAQDEARDAFTDDLHSSLDEVLG